MNLTTIGFILCGIVISLLLFFIRNLLKQTEQLDDAITDYKESAVLHATDALDKMRDVDLRGAFESDDEVGTTFKDIQEIVNDLSIKLS